LKCCAESTTICTDGSLTARPGGHVGEALRLLVTHIDDEEFDLFPHIFGALDPEQWDEIELAHRAIEAVWHDDEPTSPTGQSRDDPTRERDV
jgi:hypothetical protein